MDDPQRKDQDMNEDQGEYIGGVWVPADPMDMLQCESCQ